MICSRRSVTNPAPVQAPNSAPRSAPATPISFVLRLHALTAILALSLRCTVPQARHPRLCPIVVIPAPRRSQTGIPMDKSKKQYLYMERCIRDALRHNGNSPLQSVLSAANRETYQMAQLQGPNFKYVRHFIGLVDRLFISQLKECK